MQIVDWLRSLLDHLTVEADLLALAALTLLALRAVLHRTRIGHRLDAALSLLILAAVAHFVVLTTPVDARGALFPYARALAVAAFAIAAVRIGLVLFVDFYLRERRGRSVSAIVRDVGSVLAYFLIIFGVLRLILDINLASLVATSAVLTAIVGLALQDVLTSVVSGLVLELEEPFNVRDWVRVGSFEGEVVEIGWRTTRLRTRVNELVVLPNIYMAREPLVNYSRPDPRYGDTLYVEAAYEAPPNAVKAAVMRVLTAEPAILATPSPQVLTWQYNASGIQYAVRYWIDDFAALTGIRDRVLTNVWYALRRAGVRIPFPATDLFVYPAAPTSPLEGGDVAAALARVALLQPLTPEELRALATQVQRLPFARGEAIVREGDQGDSFYIVERGEVAVSIGGGDGTDARTIDRIQAGSCFGEMSLLAGEPRSATVVAETDVAVIEVGRAAFEKILAANPALLEPLSQLAARRSASQHQRRAEVILPPFAQDAAAQHLLQRIKAFFGL
jgi:small-conductance mechanosensitive channel/CRP-like cAMP-binding protein